MIHHGYDWTLASDDGDAWRPLLERFPDLGAVAGSRQLKSNHFRTVFHLPSQTLSLPQAVIAKVYRYTSSWDRIRYRFLRHRALQEWTALRRFAELGLPTARGVAVAELRAGRTLVGGGLIVSYLEHTRPLSEVASTIFDDPGRWEEGFQLLQDVGRLVRRVHDAGVWHRDLHAGNLLVGRAGEVFLIDLHTCYFLRRLWCWQRLGGLAKLSHSLRNGVPSEALSRLVRAYGVETLGDDPRDIQLALEQKVERIHRVRVKSRSRRCFLPSTQFCVSRRSDGVVHHLRRHAVETLEDLWTKEPSGQILKRSLHGWVARASIGEVPVCVKYRHYGWLESVQALFESHRLRRAYGGGHALAVRGIATPEIIALREIRRCGFVREAYLVTAFIENAVPLDEHLFSAYWRSEVTPELARAKHRLAEALGRLVRLLHKGGLYPQDLSPQNVLVRPQALLSASPAIAPGHGEAPTLLLTDLDHLYLWKPLIERGRRKNLAQIANLPEGHVSTTDLWRGWCAYARDDAARRDRPFVAGLRRQLLAEHWKVLANAYRGEVARQGAGAP